MDKETFSTSNDFDIVEVPIKGGVVHVRTMLHSDAETYEQDSMKRGESKDWLGFKAGLLRLTLCTEDGKFLFPDTEEAEALEVINRKSRLTVDALFEAAQKINGYEAEAAEDDAKN